MLQDASILTNCMAYFPLLFFFGHFCQLRDYPPFKVERSLIKELSLPFRKKLETKALF